MGYKSVMRSVSASANKVSREYERKLKAEQREYGRLQKKVEKLEEKKEKIMNSLQDLYAKGKISEEEYSKLQEREKGIDYPLLCFGKTAGVSLAKRYICGKIDIDEFKKIQGELVPSGVFSEQEAISAQLNKQKSSLDAFRSVCNKELDGTCQKCGKKKSFLSPIKNYIGMELCGSCKKECVSLETYKGFSGEFFKVESTSIESDKIEVNLRPEHL